MVIETVSWRFAVLAFSYSEVWYGMVWYSVCEVQSKFVEYGLELEERLIEWDGMHRFRLTRVLSLIAA